MGATRAVAIDIFKALTGFGMLVFFTNLSLVKFQVRYMALFLLFSVIDGFGWSWMESLHRNIHLSPILFLYINDLLGDVVCNIAIYSKCDQASDPWQQLELASELESDLRDTVGWGRKWLVNFNTTKTQLVSFDQSNNTGAIDVKINGSVFEKNSPFKMLGLTFSSKLDWCSYIISIAKTASNKTGALIHSMKFLSPEVTLYPYKSTIQSCMKYCCCVWACAPSSYLELLDELQKQICRTVGPSLATSFETLAHHWNVVFSLCIALTGVHLNWLNWFCFLTLKRPTGYSNRLHDFSVTIPIF